MLSATQVSSMIKPEIELGTQKWTAAELRQLLPVKRDAILAAAAQRAYQDYCIDSETTIMNKPQFPKGWDEQRIRDYYAWAQAVVAGCRGVNAFLEAKFDEAWRSGQK